MRPTPTVGACATPRNGARWVAIPAIVPSPHFQYDRLAMERQREDTTAPGTPSLAEKARWALAGVSRSGLRHGAMPWVAGIVAPALRLAEDGGADLSADGWRWEMICDVLAGIAREGEAFDVSELIPVDPRYLIAWMGSSPARAARVTNALRYLPCENPGIERWIRRVSGMEITDLIELAYLDETQQVAAALRATLRGPTPPPSRDAPSSGSPRT